MAVPVIVIGDDGMLGSIAHGIERLRSLAAGRDAWQELTRRARPHALALAVVLLACAIGQAIVLVQTPLVAQFPDTEQYLSAARHILTAQQFIDPWRTPGYPVLLALIFALTGGEHLHAVVIAQAALIVAAAVEIYALVYRVRGRRWEAALIAALGGLNPFVVNWERCILTEALCYWLAVTLFLVFERVLARRTTGALIWMTAISIALIFTRPQFIFLPVLLALVLLVRDMRMRALKRRWKPIALSLVATYALIVGYMAANGAVNGYFGLSDIASLNLFGKVLEYRLYRMDPAPSPDANPRMAQFKADVAAYMAVGHEHIWALDVWDFVYEHPEYDANHWAIYGTYSLPLIEQHPLVYLTRTIPDIVACTYDSPQFWAPFSFTPAWLVSLWGFFTFLARAFAFLPLLLVALAIQAWRRAEDPGRALLFALVLALAANIVMTALTDFIEFSRLRSPLDWALTLAFVLGVIDTVQWLAARMAMARTKRQQMSPVGTSTGWRLPARRTP
jgi:4-amino-4-deoxy-L-arabinose transferase-like glycosyltransferase